MKRFFFPIVPLLIIAAACGGGPSGAPPPPPAAPLDAAAEDDLILRLSGELVADPQTPQERDHNAIVNYALDSLLDVRATSSGLFCLIRAEGEGAPLAWGERVRVHYRGFFLDGGGEFDSSYRRGKPIEFYVGNMIDGWNEGLQLLRPGSRALFLVPAHLAYGDEGLSDGRGGFLVPPGRNLGFELDVLGRVEE